MAEKLTAKGVENIKPGPSRREIPDRLLPGLYLVVQPSGVKSWAIRYRHDGRPKKLTLGPVLSLAPGEPEPEPKMDAALTLAGARKLGAEKLREVSRGVDAAAVKRTEKKVARDPELRERDLFENVARLFVERYAKPKNRSWQETARLLGLRPDPEQADLPVERRALVTVKGKGRKEPCVAWRGRQVQTITRRDVVDVLDGLTAQGKATTANRTLAAVRRMFAWCVERGVLEASPAAGVKPPAAEVTRDRVLRDDELRLVWQEAEALGHPFGPILQLLVLTGQRRSEVTGMTWAEVDLEAKTWTIPRGRMKRDRAHEVPLSAPALDILERMSALRLAGCGLVFSTTGRTPPSGFSKVKERMDGRLAKQGMTDPWRLHDIRRTVASGMARLGISLPVIEKVLAHESGSFAGVVGIYQRHHFSDEKREALDSWAEHVLATVRKSEHEGETASAA